MMKLARILKPRSFLGLLEKNDFASLSPASSFTSSAGISTIGQSVGENEKVYAAYNVYKGKAALAASPVLPKFSLTNNGGLRVDRPGVMMLRFSPAIGERKYDWERKQVFALNVTEVGSLISLGPKDSCEFFHDPSMGSSNAGQVRKTLSVKAHEGGSGYFVTLSVASNIKQVNERMTVSLTSAEFAVMRTAFNFALPLIMGWDRYSNQLPPRLDGYSNKLHGAPPKVDREDLDAEWDR